MMKASDGEPPIVFEDEGALILVTQEYHDSCVEALRTFPSSLVLEALSLVPIGHYLIPVKTK